MYQYSLDFFFELFEQCIHDTVSAMPDALEERWESMGDTLTRRMFHAVCEGLFARHKAVFAFMLAVAVQLNAGGHLC